MNASVRPNHPLPTSLEAPGRRLFSRGATAAALLLSLALAGCGGTASSDAPTVTLATTPTAASAGASITLIAVASSDLGISAVQFYRVDASTSTLLGTMNSSPYQFTTTLPSDATDAVTYFARAIDTDSVTGDSNDASVTVTD